MVKALNLYWLILTQPIFIYSYYKYNESEAGRIDNFRLTHYPPFTSLPGAKKCVRYGQPSAFLAWTCFGLLKERSPEIRESDWNRNFRLVHECPINIKEIRNFKQLHLQHHNPKWKGSRPECPTCTLASRSSPSAWTGKKERRSSDSKIIRYDNRSQ